MAEVVWTHEALDDLDGIGAFHARTSPAYAAALVDGKSDSVMSRIMVFPSAVKRDSAVDSWMHDRSGALGAIAQHWFEVMRACGEDVRELLHDGHPTACVGDAAFCYVNAFTAHVNVGFFLGAELPDPSGLLEGTGKFMRHVKLRPEGEIDASALRKLIEMAYLGMKSRLKAA